MRKLNDTQLVILVNAAQRDDDAIHPLPNSIGLNKAAQTRVLKALLKRGLVFERPATGATNGWRRAEDGQRLDLAITEVGFEAVGIDPSATDERESAKPLAPRKRGSVAKKVAPGVNNSTPIPRRGTKLALLVDMVSRPQGATIAEIS